MGVQFDFDRDVQPHHMTTYLHLPGHFEDFQESGFATLAEWLEDNDHFRHWVIEDLEEGRY